MVDYMNARGVCENCGEFMGWADGPPHKCHSPITEVMNELIEAQKNFPKFASIHEGYAIIKEELDELWEEVRKQYNVRSKDKMRKEAKQIAAMAIRFMYDLCE